MRCIYAGSGGLRYSVCMGGRARACEAVLTSMPTCADVISTMDGPSSKRHSAAQHPLHYTPLLNGQITPDGSFFYVDSVTGWIAVRVGA